MKKLTFLVCILTALVSCNNNVPKVNSGTQDVQKGDSGTNNSQEDIENNISDKDYKIEKDQSNDVLVKLFVYIPDTSKLKSINKFLMKEYNNDKNKWYNVFYFNKKGIAYKYLASVDDRSISNKEWEKKYSKYNVFCNINFNPNSGEETFEYNN